MQKNIAATIFYSFLLALGGAPTLAMIMVQAQIVDQQQLYAVFVSLTVVFACVLIPLVGIQNIYLWLKRNDSMLDRKLTHYAHFCLCLNALCLAYWLAYPYLYT